MNAPAECFCQMRLRGKSNEIRVRATVAGRGCGDGGGPCHGGQRISQAGQTEDKGFGETEAKLTMRAMLAYNRHMNQTGHEYAPVVGHGSGCCRRHLCVVEWRMDASPTLSAVAPANWRMQSRAHWD